MQEYEVTLQRLMIVFQVTRCISGDYVAGISSTITVILCCFGLSKNMHHTWNISSFLQKKESCEK